VRIATGEDEDSLIDDGMGAAAIVLAAKGGRKRAEKMTLERRAEIAGAAAAKRCAKKGLTRVVFSIIN
jgi:hypothetical protein